MCNILNVLVCMDLGGRFFSLKTEFFSMLICVNHYISGMVEHIELVLVSLEKGCPLVCCGVPNSIPAIWDCLPGNDTSSN